MNRQEHWSTRSVMWTYLHSPFEMLSCLFFLLRTYEDLYPANAGRFILAVQLESLVNP